MTVNRTLDWDRDRDLNLEPVQGRIRSGERLKSLAPIRLSSTTDLPCARCVRRNSQRRDGHCGRRASLRWHSFHRKALLPCARDRQHVLVEVQRRRR